ncbi:uncharacterized protein METZ01_LOCUS321908, partial [marine metagenome]
VTTGNRRHNPRHPNHRFVFKSPHRLKRRCRVAAPGIPKDPLIDTGIVGRLDLCSNLGTFINRLPKTEILEPRPSQASPSYLLRSAQGVR